MRLLDHVFQALLTLPYDHYQDVLARFKACRNWTTACTFHTSRRRADRHVQACANSDTASSISPRAGTFLSSSLDASRAFTASHRASFAWRSAYASVSRSGARQCSDGSSTIHVGRHYVLNEERKCESASGKQVWRELTTMRLQYESGLTPLAIWIPKDELQQFGALLANLAASANHVA